jgi:alpha-mannosidase
LQTGERLREAAIQALVEPEPEARRLCVVNTLSAPRRQVVELPEGMPSGQTAANGKPLGMVSAPAMGYAIAAPVTRPAAPVRLTESADHITLENEFVCATFKRDGHLASLFDKRAQRECVAPGAVANHFVLFDDHPARWEAWDVDIFHLEKRYEVSGARSVRVTETGPLRAAVEFEYALSPASTLQQTASLTALSPRLDFDTEVEWHEKLKFLKVEFPLDIRAQNATYEIQFGHLSRPTHFNTSWDMARFEVCGHKWADLSEPDYGVALLNNCKYGYGTQGNVMRLSLLRSPQSPDPAADMGHHTFSYALLPHVGTLQQAGVVQEGYRFNVPLLLRATKAQPGEVSFFNVSLPSVIIDTVKQAQDSHAIIVRLYEAHGTHGTARLSSSLPVQSATRCNLLEEEDAPLDWAEGGVTLKFTPFQIITVKLLRTGRA